MSAPNFRATRMVSQYMRCFGRLASSMRMLRLVSTLENWRRRGSSGSVRSHAGRSSVSADSGQFTEAGDQCLCITEQVIARTQAISRYENRCHRR